MRYRFIINPGAGRGRHRGGLMALIEREMGRVGGHRFEIRLTEGPAHAIALAKEAAEDGYDMAVAVGGDGTMNEVASGLVNSGTALGLIPRGSGNGFAGSMRIPAGALDAMALILSPSFRRIDVGTVNGRHFFGVAGVGFDALVARRFQGFPFRGPLPYFIISLKEFLLYQPLPVTVEIDGAVSKERPLLIAFANTSTYGSGAVIAPHADPEDGLLDVCVVDKAPALETLRNLPRLFNGRLDEAPFHKTVKARAFSIGLDTEEAYFHADGEPVRCGRELKISVLPGALRVCAPPRRQ